MSADGRLTSDIVGRALVNSIGELEERVRSAPLTLSQSGTLMRNEFVVLTKTINDTFQITQRMTELVKFFSNIVRAVNENSEALETLKAVINGVIIALLAVIGVKAIVYFNGLAASITLVTASATAGTGALYSFGFALGKVIAALGFLKPVIAALGGGWVLLGAATLGAAYALGGLS